jgi:hypothetical protein
MEGREKLPLAYAPIRKSSKLGLTQICSKQARELVALRVEVIALRAAASKPAPSPAAGKIASREEAKTKFGAEIAAAKLIHAELAALERAEAPERARLQAEWEKEQCEERRERKNTGGRLYRANHIEQRREGARRWQAANPDKVKLHNDRGNAVRRQKRAAARLERVVSLAKRDTGWQEGLRIEAKEEATQCEV